MTAGPGVHQVVPYLERGDAIGNEVRMLARELRAQGYRSEIFTLDAARHRHEARPLETLAATPGTAAVVYHFAVASAATEYVRRLDAPVILRHHNVTPAAHYYGIDRAYYDSCRLARAETLLLCDRVALALGDSRFTADELAAMGFTPTGVVPIVLDQAPYRPGPASLPDALPPVAGPVLLVVGRVAPHKRVEDAIRLLHVHRTTVDATARLWVAGDRERLPRYARALEALCAELGEDGVHWLGKVTPEGLIDCYRSASALLSMSVHEGFGLPLLEAMLMDVPVLARRAAAVPETLGGAGLLFGGDTPDTASVLEAAVLLDRLLSDPELRERQRQLGRSRAKALAPRPAMDTLGDQLVTILRTSTSPR